MAYLDNQDLWYELFQTRTGDVPGWWSELLESRARFTRAVLKLRDYSLIEVYEGRYSLHTCVHDWTLECLNQPFDEERCGMAIRCVAASVSWDSEEEYWARNRRVLAHARRFQLARFRGLIDWSGIMPDDLVYLAAIYKQNDMHKEAEEMYVRALRGYEKAWGPEHKATLDTVNNLGILYADQGKMAEAEEMYVRALRGFEKAWGPEHTSTRSTVNNLGNLYKDQGKKAEAEEVYMRVLRGYEKAVGTDRWRTRTIVRSLHNLHK